MTTIDQVAALAKVSAATVSRVLNQSPGVRQQTRERVNRALEKLAYKPNYAAQALARSKEKSLGLIIATLSEPFFMSVADSTGNACQTESIQLITLLGGQSAQTEEAALRSAQEHNCRSIVFHSKYLSDEKLAEILRQTPGLILLNRLLPSHPERCVWLDNICGAEKMVHHLVNLGHRSFVYINSVFEIGDPDDRLAGWKKGLQASGLDPTLLRGECENPTLEGGYRATQRLIKKGVRFTGVLAYDDSMAAGAIRALRDQGIEVPRDVSVVGFNDAYVARFTIPKITTMHYPVEQMAQRAAMLALTSAEERDIGDKNAGRFVPVIVERQSVTFCPEIARGSE